MPVPKDEAKQIVAELVARYQSLSVTETKKFNEEATKQGFILPLFKALGWNVEDTNDEVVPEDTAGPGRVDYAFRIGGTARFFVEAKALKADLTDAKSIKQAIGYALQRGVTWAVLTSFTEFHVFYALGDAIKPDMLRWKTLQYSDFIDHFEDLWLMSRESIASGDTDKEARRSGQLPPRLPIEKRLFRQLTEWREKLTNNLLRWHENELTDMQVDEVVERLFNRLIFIRICEDRQFEDKLLWQILQDNVNSYGKTDLVKAVRQVFNKYRDWYDSDLFPIEPHMLDRPELVQLDDSLIRDVLRGLYTLPGGYAQYDFSLIDADVLGAVYEQYLGHVAQVTRERAEKKAKQMALMGLEREGVQFVEKRAKRKGQGIYYTPKWVVDYIVRQTVRKTLDECGAHKDAREQCLRELRILDPSCGSGSFLIRAYSEILHQANDLYEGNKLLVAEDQPGVILKRSIFGVDLDPQAVDIARLNLMARGLTHRELLPELKENIQIGNSLVSGTESELRKYFGAEWENKRPFNWIERIPFLQEKRFDVIIGNPPYFNIETLGKDSIDATWIKDKFPDVWMDKSDILFYFIAQSILLLQGRMGFIVSRSFLEADKAQKLRDFILRNCSIETIIDFRDFMVFEDASIACVVVILRRELDTAKRSSTNIKVAQVHTSEVDGADLIRAIEGRFIEEEWIGDDFSTFCYPQSRLSSGSWAFAARAKEELFAKIDDAYPKLGNLCFVGEGMQTGANKVFEVSEAIIEEKGLERESLRRRATNSDINKYVITHSGTWLIWLEERNEFADCPKHIGVYLESQRHELEKRAAFIRGNCEWFKFTWPLHKEWYKKPKLIAPYRSPENRFALDETGEYIGLTDTTVVFLKDGDQVDPRYYLALLNSKLLTFRYRGIGKVTGGGLYEYFENGVSQLPIRTINFADNRDVEMYTEVISLSNRVILLKNRIAEMGIIRDNQREELERSLADTTDAIDRLVCKLYRLTENEKTIISIST